MTKFDLTRDHFLAIFLLNSPLPIPLHDRVPMLLHHGINQSPLKQEQKSHRTKAKRPIKTLRIRLQHHDRANVRLSRRLPRLV